MAERESLVEAGLGEKLIFISDISCSSHEFKGAIIDAFPKLEDCGGFELLRCLPNSKQLELISTSVAQSPKLLKSVVANGRVFIRPIQKDLSLLPDENLSSTIQVYACLCTGSNFLYY